MNIPSVDHSAEFAAWWQAAFPGTQCPPVPKKESDLGMTQRMALTADNPILAQNLFGNSGRGSAPLPADTQARLNQGQLQPQDAPHLRAAGLEHYARQCEQLAQRQFDQRLVDQTVASQQSYEQARQRSEAWSQAGLLERLGHTPVDPQVAARFRQQWGISG